MTFPLLLKSIQKNPFKTLLKQTKTTQIYFKMKLIYRKISFILKLNMFF